MMPQKTNTLSEIPFFNSNRIFENISIIINLFLK